MKDIKTFAAFVAGQCQLESAHHLRRRDSSFPFPYFLWKGGNGEEGEDGEDDKRYEEDVDNSSGNKPSMKHKYLRWKFRKGQKEPTEDEPEEEYPELEENFSEFKSEPNANEDYDNHSEDLTDAASNESKKDFVEDSCSDETEEAQNHYYENNVQKNIDTKSNDSHSEEAPSTLDDDKSSQQEMDHDNELSTSTETRMLHLKKRAELEDNNQAENEANEKTTSEMDQKEEENRYVCFVDGIQRLTRTIDLTNHLFATLSVTPDITLIALSVFVF